jgi:hypothetical protein
MRAWAINFVSPVPSQPVTNTYGKPSSVEFVFVRVHVHDRMERVMLFLQGG